MKAEYGFVPKFIRDNLIIVTKPTEVYKQQSLSDQIKRMISSGQVGPEALPHWLLAARAECLALSQTPDIEINRFFKNMAGHYSFLLRNPGQQAYAAQAFIDQFREDRANPLKAGDFLTCRRLDMAIERWERVRDNVSVRPR